MNGSDYDKIFKNIKQSQINAIEITVERCVEKSDTIDIEDCPFVDRQSILDIAIKMKEEL